MRSRRARATHGAMVAGINEVSTAEVRGHYQIVAASVR